MMKENNADCTVCPLRALSAQVRSLLVNGQDDKALDLCRHSLVDHPDSPVVQNLIGIVDEDEGKRQLGLRHFGAASALDPGYAPSRENLEAYGNVFGKPKPVYSEDDCPSKPDGEYEIVKENGLNVVRRKS